jgi:integrase
MQQHVCRGLSASSVRQVLWILSGAFDKAVRWKWIALNPAHQADKPALPHPDPRPPSAADASRIVTEAWRDPDWGTFVWCAMTLGARRGELCALRWRNVDLANNVVTLRHAIAVGPDRQLVERSTRTHQQRRVVLDDETVQVLADHRRLRHERVHALGVELSPDAFVFSTAPDGSTFPLPDTMTQRYDRLAKRLGIDSHLHALRHYSATELIAAGTDIRTVAGRLGHGGGGSTTLRVYAAWLSEADQRAASVLSGRMPARSATPAALSGGVRTSRSCPPLPSSTTTASAPAGKPRDSIGRPVTSCSARAWAGRSRVLVPDSHRCTVRLLTAMRSPCFSAAR